MNHEEYLLNEAYERSETPLNDPEPIMFYVLCNGDEIVFTTNEREEALREYLRVVDLNESGDSDDYAVDMMECEGEHFSLSNVIKTLGYSEVVNGNSWNRI